MIKTKLRNFNKRTLLGIIILGILLGTLPLLVHEVQEPISQQTQAATLVLKQFPGLEWTKPNQEKVSVLLDEGTENEGLVLAIGQKSSAISTTPISEEVFNFYDKEFKLKDFPKVTLVGNPKSDNYWVAHYHKGQQYAEIEYYPTPYKTGSFTVVLFFGILREDD